MNGLDRGLREGSFLTHNHGLTDGLSRGLISLDDSFSNNKKNLARKFLFATGITDSGISRACYLLEERWRDGGVIDLVKAYYPFAGGTAFTHKFNFMNAKDTNEAFRLSFLGGWTHTSTGGQPNGSTGYADTFFIPATHFSGINNKSMGYYSRRTGNTRGLMGAYGSSCHDLLIPRFDDANDYSALSYNVTTSVANLGDGQAFHIISKTTSGGIDRYRNKSKTFRAEPTGGTQSTVSIVLSAVRFLDTTINYLSPSECAGAFIADGLTEVQENLIYDSIQEFNTTLGRQI